jgi:hypothetical protein
MKMKLLYNQLVAFVLLASIAACAKDAAKASSNTSYRLLSDKTWYLQYTVTSNGISDSTHSYVGQPTYFINYRKNLSTLDSDGIEGTFSIQESANQLLIIVNAKTANGNASNYQYEVVSLGAKNMILKFTRGTAITKLFFSTER